MRKSAHSSGKSATHLAGDPVDLAVGGVGDGEEDQFGDTFRESLGVGQGQSRTPGAAQHQPAVDAKILAQQLDVGDQMMGCVDGEIGRVFRRAGRTPAGSALIEADDSVLLRVIERAPEGRATRAGTAMKVDRRFTGWVAGFFPVDVVSIPNVEKAGHIRFDWRVEISGHDRRLRGSGFRQGRADRTVVVWSHTGIVILILQG